MTDTASAMGQAFDDAKSRILGLSRFKGEGYARLTFTNPFTTHMKTAPGVISGGRFHLVAGTGFEPATSGL